jgi:NADH:ubiquinone oxidoreductase subunit 5 (subunit L)/multisubunit Na+/H+ antiporter MnhA subunit
MNGLDKIAFLIKSGTSLSVTGIAILVLFAFILLVFPVSKFCPQNQVDCEYVSEAPSLLRAMINPYVLVFSLLIVACGVCLFRFGYWYLNKCRRNEKNTNRY